MGLIFMSAGLVVVTAVYVDAFITTVAAQGGAGPITRRLTNTCWRLALVRSRRTGDRRWLSRSGPVLLVGTVVVWVLGLWAGWTLVFLAGDDVVRDASTGEPVGPLGVIYFVGFSLVTLGVGDVVATGPGWGLVATVASFGGLFLLTLAITYLVSVVSAAVSRRALAVQIHSLGASPSDVVAWAWTGHGFSDAALQQMSSLAEPLLVSSERHLAYPILDHFESAELIGSAPPAVARLDEALLLLEHGVASTDRPGRDVTGPVRGAIDRYVDVVTRNVRGAPRVAAPPPALQDLAELRRQGIPVVSDAEYSVSMAQLETTRAPMAHHVCHSGWDWSAVGVAQGRGDP